MFGKSLPQGQIIVIKNKKQSEDIKAFIKMKHLVIICLSDESEVIENCKEHGTTVIPIINKKAIENDYVEENEKLLMEKHCPGTLKSETAQIIPYEETKQLSLKSFIMFVSSLYKGMRIIITEEKHCDEFKKSWDTLNKEEEKGEKTYCKFDTVCICKIVK